MRVEEAAFCRQTEVRTPTPYDTPHHTTPSRRPIRPARPRRFTLSGCGNSLDSSTCETVAAATTNDTNYGALNTALTAAILRLEGLESNTGSPDAYLAADIKILAHAGGQRRRRG